MSVRVWSLAWSVPLPTAEKITLLCLANTCRDDGSEAWRTLARMAAETGLNERTVRRSLRSLEAAGLIAVTRPADAGRKRTTVYSINLPETVETGDTMSPLPGTGDTVSGVGGTLCPGTGDTTPPSPYYSPSNISEEVGASAPTAREAHPPATDDLFVIEEAAEPEADIAEQMLAEWKRELKGIVPVPSKLDAALRRAAKQRLADSCGGSLEAWSMAVQKIAASTFLTGGGKQGWRATFKWILKPGNLQRLADGEFDDADRRPTGPRSIVETYAEIAADLEAEAAGIPRKPKSDRARRLDPGVRWAMGQGGRGILDDTADTFDAIRRNQGVPGFE